MDHIYLLFGLLASLGASPPHIAVQSRAPLAFQCATSQQAASKPVAVQLEQADCRRKAKLIADRYQANSRTKQQMRQRMASASTSRR